MFFSLLFQTPLKLDAVKALRKEPVVETKIPFVRESKQATHLYVTLVFLKKINLIIDNLMLNRWLLGQIVLIIIPYSRYIRWMHRCILHMYGISYRLRHQSRSQQPTALQRMASSSGRGLLEQVAGITGLTSKLKK